MNKWYVLATSMMDSVSCTDLTHELTLCCPSVNLVEPVDVPVCVRPKSMYCDTGLSVWHSGFEAFSEASTR